MQTELHQCHHGSVSIPLPPLAVFILENTTGLQNLKKKIETYILGLFYICSLLSTL